VIPFLAISSPSPYTSPIPPEADPPAAEKGEGTTDDLLAVEGVLSHRPLRGTFDLINFLVYIKTAEFASLYFGIAEQL